MNLAAKMLANIGIGVRAKSFDGGYDWVSSDQPGNLYSSTGRRGYDYSPGTAVNYERLAGDLWNNSACQSVLNWVIRAWPESYPCVKQEWGSKKVVKNHPLTTLLLDPNEFDDDTSLWAATITSFWADGNAYWRINRTRGGQVGEFEYIPHWAICPHRNIGSSNPGPDYYEMGTPKGPIKFAPYDIVHYRFGKDPDNDLLGMSSWKSVSREVYTDNEAVNYTNSTLRNRGAAWMVVSPKDPTVGFDDIEGLRSQLEQRTTGDNRNRILVLENAAQVDIPPPMKDMGIADLRRLPETRICALAGIPAMAVGLAAGLERSTFSNVEEANTAAWYTIMAVQRMMGRQLTKQVLWEPRNFGSATNARSYYAGFDYSEVRALQEDRDARDERERENFLANGISRDEFRVAIGLAPVDNKPVYSVDLVQVVTPSKPIQNAANQADPNDKKAYAIVDGSLLKQIEAGDEAEEYAE